MFANVQHAYPRFIQTIQPKPDEENNFTHKHTMGAQKTGESRDPALVSDLLLTV